MRMQHVSRKAWSTVMAINVRLNNDEQERIRKKAIELNKVLVNKGLEPIRDSELVHKILDQTIESIEISASGEIIVLNKI